MNKNFLTKEGVKKIQDELHFLSTTEKNRILTDLSDARERGNIEENSEYTSAKEEYEKLQAKISKLQYTLTHSHIISTQDVATDKVTVLSSVKVLNVVSEKEMTFMIVPENEIDIKSGKISANSPIGHGLLGKTVGEVCDIITPAGNMKFKILDIRL